MSIIRSPLIDRVRSSGVITDADVGELRLAFYADSRILRPEADVLFDLNEACQTQSAAWVAFFVEAITDYLVFDAEPEGYLTCGNADWLISRIGRDGRACSLTELELLVNVLDKARWAPERLSAYALDQVRQAVVSGVGVLRNFPAPKAGVVTDADVELIRRVLYAFSSGQNVAVGRSEAEVLFAIDAATADGEPNPAWTDLFVKAIASCLMAAAGYAVPTRAEALRREAWLASRGDLALPGMLAGLVSKSLSGVIGLYRERSAEERALARLDRQRIEIITNESVTGTEIEWLEAMMDVDGRLSANETALLAYLEASSPDLLRSIRPLLERAGIAA